MQKEEAREVGKGGMVKGLWWVDGEGIVEMSWEGVDESCHEVVGQEVGFEIPGKCVGDLGLNMVAEAEELNRKVTRNGWWCLKGRAEAVTGVDDGAV